MEEEDYEEGCSKYWSNWSVDYFENLDTSQYPFPNTLWNVKPAKEVAIKTSIMLLIGVSGLFFNFVILLIIIRNKWLWSASNYLIANMAFVDFITLLFCPWFMLVRDFYQNYVLRNFGCRFEGFLQASLLLESVASVMLVSYDRLAAAAFTSDARITKKVAPRLILGSWIFCALLALPWCINRTYVVRPYEKERLWLDHVEMYCAEDVKVMSVYWHFILTLLVWIPLGVMVFTYTAIMYRLECSVRKFSSRGGGRVIDRARGRALRISACVLITAVICRVPYTALMYWRNNLPVEINVVDGSFSNMWFAANCLIYMNCTLSPLIYGFTNFRFRKAMDRTTPVSWCRFGSWCCVVPSFKKKKSMGEDKNTEKIFVIADSPRPNKKIKKALKNILHINKDTVEFSLNKNEEFTAKPTKCTPLKTEPL